MKTVSVRYQGDEPCWTPVPAVDWQPGETKSLSQEDATFLLTNEAFKVAEPPSFKPTEVNVSG